MFHRHKWKIVEQTEHPSAYEQMTAGGTYPTKVKSSFGLEFTFWTRPVIVKRVCETCGTEEVRRV